MTKLKEGSVVKPNPTLFKPEMKPWDHVGALGMPALFKDFKFKIVEIFNHSYHGTLAKLEGVNQKFEDFVVLKLDELVPASMKLTIDYKVLEASADTERIKAQIANFEREIELAIASGKYKPTGRKVSGLKKQISELILQLDNSMNRVYLPKFKRTVSVSAGVIGNEQELKQALASKVSELRQEYRQAPEEVTKTVMSNYKVTLVGGVHVKPNVYGEIYEKSLVELIEKPKIPTSPSENYLGIEIECLVKDGSVKLLKELLCKQRLHKHVQVGSDGSINSDVGGYKGIEIRVLVTERELQSVMAKLSKCLKHRKIDAYANRSCGLHVHLDMRNRNHVTSFNKLFNVQSLLRKSQPTSRLDSQYCKPAKTGDFDKERERSERYSVINTVSYGKHKTLEVRVHEGTVNTKDITNWCMFLIGVLNSEINTVVENVSQLRGMSFEKSALDYIESRIEEFDTEVA